MKQVWNQLTCLNCGNKIIQISDMILNPTIDSTLKEKILNDDWMSSKCTNCGKVIRSIYPCIYKDTQKKVLIHVKKIFEVTQNGYQQRYVNDRDSFKELVQILEDNMDDQQVMKIKKMFYQKHQKVSYVTSDDEYVIFNCDDQIKMVLKKPCENKIENKLLEYRL